MSIVINRLQPLFLEVKRTGEEKKKITTVTATEKFTNGHYPKPNPIHLKAPSL